MNPTDRLILGIAIIAFIYCAIIFCCLILIFMIENKDKKGQKNDKKL